MVRTRNRTTVWVSIVFLSLSCTSEYPPINIESPSEDTYTQPPSSFETAAPDYIINGVEIIDPFKQLKGLDVSASKIVLINRPLTRELVDDAWGLLPEASFAKPVYIRMPLSRPLAEGTEIELLQRREEATGDLVWETASLGRSIGGGQVALFAIRDFATTVLSLTDPNRMAFFRGTTCDGSPTTIYPPYAPGDRSCGSGCSETAKAPPQNFSSSQGMSPTGPLLHMKEDAAFAEAILFKNEECDLRYPQCHEDEWGSPALYWPLRRLADLVNARSCGSLALRVTETFDSGTPEKPQGEHSANSRHYVGRAMDLHLVAATNGIPPEEAKAQKQPHLYGHLAALAQEAGFDWIWYENRGPKSHWHVHASVQPHYYYFVTPEVHDANNQTIAPAKAWLFDLEAPIPKQSIMETGYSSQSIACSASGGIVFTAFSGSPYRMWLSRISPSGGQTASGVLFTSESGYINITDIPAIAECNGRVYFNTPTITDGNSNIVERARLKSLDTATGTTRTEFLSSGGVGAIVCSSDGSGILLSNTERNPLRATLTRWRWGDGGPQSVRPLFSSAAGYVNVFSRAAIAECNNTLYYSTPRITNDQGEVIEKSALIAVDLDTGGPATLALSDGMINSVSCDGAKGVIFTEDASGPFGTRLRRYNGKVFQDLGVIFGSSGGYINALSRMPVVACKYSGSASP